VGRFLDRPKRKDGSNSENSVGVQQGYECALK
jgi:hypothetical protein